MSEGSILAFCNRLGDSYIDLTLYFGIIGRVSRRWEPGREGEGIIEWLHSRDRLYLLKKAIVEIDRKDLVELSVKVIQEIESCGGTSPQNIPQTVKGVAPSHQKWRQDWGEAQDVSVFYGRTSELATLEQWIVNQGCRLVAIVGMGGIGKTDLSLKLARGIQDNFEYVIWRSLLNGPPVINILADWIKFLSNQQEIDLPHTLDGQISRLLHYLRQHPCLLILDNAETILQGGDRAGQYREGYEEYGQLFESIGLVSHESCLLLTTREKPREIRRMPGQTPPVRCLELKGLDSNEGREIFTEMGNFSGSDGEWRELIEFYNGNPLALELAANHIAEVFGGNRGDRARWQDFIQWQ